MDSKIYKIVDFSYPEIYHAQAVQIPVLRDRLKLDGTEIYIKTTQERIDDYMSSQGVSFEQIFPPEMTQNFPDCESVKIVLDSTGWTNTDF